MICPKCGLEQEERLDCKDCGIVFSKYNALFPSSESSESEDNSEGSLSKSEFQELRIQVRELNSHIIDAEFEKAERKKLRSDLKDLDRRIQDNQAQLDARMKRVEDALESLSKESGSKISQEILENLPKPEEIEHKTNQLSETLNSTVSQLTSLWEKTGQNSFQIKELRDQIIVLRNDVLAAKTQMENLINKQVDQEPKTIYEDEVQAIRKNLEELGQFIIGLNRRQ